MAGGEEERAIETALALNENDWRSERHQELQDVKEGRSGAAATRADDDGSDALVQERNRTTD